MSLVTLSRGGWVPWSVGVRRGAASVQCTKSRRPRRSKDTELDVVFCFFLRKEYQCGRETPAFIIALNRHCLLHPSLGGYHSTCCSSRMTHHNDRSLPLVLSLSLVSTTPCPSHRRGKQQQVGTGNSFVVPYGFML